MENSITPSRLPFPVSPFETLEQITSRLDIGKPQYHILIPEAMSKRDQDDVPQEYVVWINSRYPGGCMIAARYRENDWIINPSHTRALVTILLHLVLPPVRPDGGIKYRTQDQVYEIDLWHDGSILNTIQFDQDEEEEAKEFIKLFNSNYDQIKCNP